MSTAQILAEGLSPPADSLCGVIGQSCTPWLKSKPIPGKLMKCPELIRTIFTMPVGLGQELLDQASCGRGCELA